MSDQFRLIAPGLELSATGEKFVLATIIATEGSTYRKAGASMLLAADGRSFGQLGGGSFETDLLSAAAPGFKDGAHRVLEFEMPSGKDADAKWKRDGTARLLLQYHGPGSDCRAMPLLAEALQASKAHVLLSVTDSSHPELPLGTSFLFGHGMDRPLPEDLAEEAAATASAALASGLCMLVQHPGAAGDVEIFYMPVRAPLRLLVLGATPDAEPVVQMGALLGWQSTVIDPRRAYCRPERFPEAIEVSELDATALRTHPRLDEFDAALLLTRNFELDAAFLEPLSESRIPFIGVLGSKSRCAKLVESAGAAASRFAGRLHGPVGLDLRPETPQEIALSIVAQVQATWDKRVRPDAGIPVAAPDLPVHAVILAAGGSKRFGGFKQLLEFQGESLLRRAVGLAEAVLPGRVIVVHGPKPLKCRRELAGFDATQVDNANWENGMATSLRVGIHAIPGESSAALILLCDQPLVRPQHLRALLHTWKANPERIVAAAYGGGAGAPAIIPRKYFADILKLSGDRGAKALLASLAAEVVPVDIPDAEFDIDTQDDYAAILKRG